MSDDELLALIEQTPPDHWTEDQMALVRERLPTSAALRKAMANRLRLEGYLAGAIGGANVSAQQIVAAAAKIRPIATKKKTTSRRWPWAVALSLLALMPVAAWKWWPEITSIAGGGPKGNTPDESQKKNGKSKPSPGVASDSNNNPSNESNPDGPEIKPVNIPAPRATEPDEPVAAAVPAVVVERQPWEHERHMGGAPAQYLTAAFVDVGRGDFTPRRDELRRWLAGVPGVRLDIQEFEENGRRLGTFEGRARLRAPWSADAMLRLALRDANKLRIYCWHGNRGVMFQYHHDRRYAWAAYVVTRDKDEIKAKTFALTATDDERGYRTSREGQLPIDVFYRNGEMVIARGGIDLVSAPLEGIPTDVELEGKARFAGLAMNRVESFPSARGAFGYTRLQRRPADRPWETKLADGASLVRNSDGTIDLIAEKAQQPSIALTPTLPTDLPSLEYRSMFARRRDIAPLPTSLSGRIYELIVCIEGASSGASVFLTNGQGETTDVARFMREKASSGRGVWLVGAGDGRAEAHEDLNNGPVPLTGETTWLRILSAGGVQKFWLSSDGQHWARPWDTRAGFAPWALGVSLPPSDSPKKIRIRQLAWRELEGLSALASDKARDAITPYDAPRNFDQWQKLAEESVPPDIETDDWLRASAIRALAANAAGDLAADLIRFLVEQISAVDMKRAKRLAALDDLALVANTQDDPRRAEMLMNAYAEASKRNDVQTSPRVYSDAVRAMTASPVTTRNGVLPQVQPLARLELLHLVDAAAWQDVDQLCRELRFRGDLQREQRTRNGQQESSIVDWAQALAQRHVPLPSGETRIPIHPAWRSPLVEQSNTQLFNVLAEFQAAIEGQAYGDAADIIAAAGAKLADAADRTSVLRDAVDEELFVSLTVAVTQAMRAHQGLASAMQERYGAAAQLRVRQAIVDGNVKLLEAATLQYHGTTAAAEAHLWLGKRALSIGEFARALDHFRGAADSGEAAIANEAKSRARLAGALVGQVSGEATTSLVQFGDSQIAAADFERVVEQIRTRTVEVSATNSATSVAVAEFTSTQRGDFRLGPVPQPRVQGDGERFEVDWFGRSSTISSSGNLLVINGRNSAAAFDTERGAPRWEARFRGSAADPDDWPNIPSRPVFFGEQVLVRWLAKTGPVLVCLNAADGSVAWQSDAAESIVIGDPFFAQDELFALVARQDALQQNWHLSLATLDRETGDVLRSRPLAKLADSWRRLAVCQTTLHADRFFLSLGGVVLCGNLSGQVHWVRSLPHVPVSVDEWTFAQLHDAPIVAGDRVFVASPSVRQLVCLDAESGRVTWRFSDPNMLKLVSHIDGAVVVRTGDALIGLNADDGQPRWRFATTEQAEVLYDSGAAGVILAQRDSQQRPELVWLDPAKGNVQGRWSDPAWSERFGQYGPLGVSSQGRIWLLRSKNPRAEVREVVELAPPGVTLDPTPSREPEKKEVDAAVALAELQKASDVTTPGWKVASGATSPAGTLIQHLESDKTVLAIAAAGKDVLFSQEVTLPAGSKARLRIKAGYVANEAWKLKITAGEKTLLDSVIGGGPQAGWQRFELELAPIAGQKSTLEMTATTPDDKPRKILLKRLLVTP